MKPEYTARVIPPQKRDREAEIALLSWLLDVRRRNRAKKAA